MIYSEESSDEGTSNVPSVFNKVQTTVLRIGNKRLRLSMALDEDDSDEEWDEWFAENVMEKIGIRFRNTWMHPLNLKRIVDGEYVRICVPLRKYDDRFFRYFRMSIATFDYILVSITDDIQKHSIRPSISPAERLAVTLR
jgi:hypothetical protein